MLSESKRNRSGTAKQESLTPEKARELLAARLGEVMADVVLPMVEEVLRAQPPKRSLYSLNELVDLGWPRHRLRWWIESRRAELEAAGAIVTEGRSVLIDPERVEAVIRGEATRGPSREAARVG